VASTRNLEAIRMLGADAVIDYTRTEITTGTRGPSGSRYDAIIDIAGNRPVALLRRALAPRGTLVIVGGTGGNLTMGFGRTVRAMLLDRFVKHRLVGLLSQPNQQDLHALAELLETGKLTPVVQATYPLDAAAEAVAAAGTGHGRGAIVVTVGREVVVQ
jgi:NADPH:quinone reductase-like Zn-dependent oxidoreductase